MKFLGALLGELNGVFGKAYLLAGLLPAAALMIGKRWFDSNEDMTSLFSTLIQEGAKAAPGLLGVASITLLLGFAFFAARSFLVGFLQTLPGRLLTPLRRALIRRQVRLRFAAASRGEKHSHTVTVFEWALERDFEQPNFLPPQVLTPQWDVTLSASRKAIALIEKLAKTKGWQPIPVPGKKQAKVITGGLKFLYAYATHNYSDTALQQELETWRLACTPRARMLLKILDAAANRDYARAANKLADFPDPKWIRPTVLGTRVSALDDYAEDRYRINTSSLMRRLTGVLPEAERTGLSDARLSIEVLVNLSFAMLILAVWVGMENLRFVWTHLHASELVFSLRTALFILAPALLALLFYRAAVFAYRELSELVIRNVDLHRLKLIKALGFKSPETFGEEQLLWQELSGFFSQADNVDPERPTEAPE